MNKALVMCAMGLSLMSGLSQAAPLCPSKSQVLSQKINYAAGDRQEGFIAFTGPFYTQGTQWQVIDGEFFVNSKMEAVKAGRQMLKTKTGSSFSKKAYLTDDKSAWFCVYHAGFNEKTGADEFVATLAPNRSYSATVGSQSKGTLKSMFSQFAR